jgi:hypothetical protein
MKNAALAALSLLLLGCASEPADPVAYQAGYSDGCESAASAPGVPPRRNEMYYKENSDYRAGWRTAHASCSANSGQR